MRDLKAAYEHAPSGSNDETALKKEVKDAEVKLKKSKMKDHYKTLGITSDATEDEIKKVSFARARLSDVVEVGADEVGIALLCTLQGYRRQSLLHHPDKGGTDEKFKEVRHFPPPPSPFLSLPSLTPLLHCAGRRSLRDSFRSSTTKEIRHGY